MLALSNPDPEIEPAAAVEAGASVAADGKSINNVLAFPGLFAGAMRAAATDFTDAMLIAAARTIAAAAPDGQLVPEALNDALHEVGRRRRRGGRRSSASADSLIDRRILGSPRSEVSPTTPLRLTRLPGRTRSWSALTCFPSVQRFLA